MPEETAKQPQKHQNRRPAIGDVVLYSLGDNSPGRGEDRPAIITYVHDLSTKSAADQAANPGLVNLSVFIGRPNDFPAQAVKGAAERAIWPVAGMTYDASGKPGTWHFKD